MSAWQPIATAPDDKSDFLAYDPVSDCFDVAFAFRKRNGKLVVTSPQYESEDGPFPDEFDGARATHWMPLPEAPTAYVEPRRPFLELD